MVVCKVVAPLGIRDLTGTFAGKTSSDGANRCAGRHPDRPTDRAQSRTSCGTAASTDALGEVVIGQIVLPAGIGNLARTFAGKTTCDRPYSSAGSHSDRAAHRTQGCPGGGSAASTDTLGQVVLAKLVAALGIGDLASSLAREAASHCANRGTCSQAASGASGPYD